MQNAAAKSMIADKVDRVAKATGLSMSSVVELALDLWLRDMSEASEQRDQMAARLALLDRAPQSGVPERRAA